MISLLIGMGAIAGVVLVSYITFSLAFEFPKLFISAFLLFSAWGIGELVCK